MKLFFSAFALAVAVPAYANMPIITERPTDAPVINAEGQGAANALNQILKQKAGNDADILDGTWLIIFGAEQISADSVGAIALAKIESIDVLTRPNGSFKGTVVISKRG